MMSGAWPSRILARVLQIRQAFGVLKALGVENALDGFLLGVAVLPDVFLGALVHGQVLHEARVGRQDHPQFVAPHALHALHGDGCRSCR